MRKLRILRKIAKIVNGPKKKTNPQLGLAILSKNFAEIVKIATLVGDLCSLAFQCGTMFAILTILAKIANFAKNRQNRRSLKRKRTQGPDKSCDFCNFDDFCENCEFCDKSQKSQNTEKKANTRPRQESDLSVGHNPEEARTPI